MAKVLNSSGYYSIYKVSQTYILVEGDWSNILQVSDNYLEILEKYLTFTKVHHVDPNLPLNTFINKQLEHLSKCEEFSMDRTCADGLSQLVR